MIKPQIRINLNYKADKESKDKILSRELFATTVSDEVICTQLGREKFGTLLYILPFKEAHYELIIEQILFELKDNKVFLVSVGCNIQADVDIDFYFEHNDQMSWYLRYTQLLELTTIIQTGYSIDSDSYIKNENIETEDKEDWSGGRDFYQLIFLIKNKAQEDYIKKMFLNLYNSHLQDAIWITKSNIMILQIRDYLKEDKWCDVSEGMLQNVRENRLDLKVAQIQVCFGMYFSDRFCSEIPYEIILEVLETEIDLVFTIDSKANKNFNHPIDCIDLLKGNKFLKDLIE